MFKSLLLSVAAIVTACSQRPVSSPDSTYVFSAKERRPTEQEIMANQEREIMRSREQKKREQADAAERAEEADEKREAAIDAQEQAEDPATRAAREERQAESQKALDFATCASGNGDRDNPYDHGKPTPGCGKTKQ